MVFENGIAKCSIEKAFNDGVIDFKKPISCHLFPIRINEYRDFDAVNYEEIKICQAACECGSALEVPLYIFLKEPLIIKNKNNDNVIINQVGSGGVYLGKIDFNFTKSSKNTTNSLLEV